MPDTKAALGHNAPLAAIPIEFCKGTRLERPRARLGSAGPWRRKVSAVVTSEMGASHVDEGASNKTQILPKSNVQPFIDKISIVLNVMARPYRCSCGRGWLLPGSTRAATRGTHYEPDWQRAPPRPGHRLGRSEPRPGMPRTPWGRYVRDGLLFTGNAAGPNALEWAVSLRPSS